MYLYISNGISFIGTLFFFLVNMILAMDSIQIALKLSRVILINLDMVCSNVRSIKILLCEFFWVDVDRDNHTNLFKY